MIRCCLPGRAVREALASGVGRLYADDMSENSRILSAIAALRVFDRDRAVALLQQELAHGPRDGDRWKSISHLAGTIGEIDISLEAARRYAGNQPSSLAKMLYYWGELSAQGRSDDAVAEVKRLPASVRNNPGVLHFLGTIAVQDGHFANGEAHFRTALAQSRLAPQTWFALAMVKTFVSSDDPDIAEMEQLRPQMARAGPALYARFLYGLAKAWHDCGDYERAFELYSEGAKLRRAEAQFDPDAFARKAEGLIKGFNAGSLAQLSPPRDAANRAIFVNGLPRSGTTLVEQILTSHSEVANGGELNLLKAALLPAGDYSISGALACQHRVGAGNDPWGDASRDYHGMLTMRFGAGGRIVDKTLLNSQYMGLLMHMLPEARVVWMRRRPEDAALSCFRTYFTASVSWSWSLTDIAAVFRAEDRLFDHWLRLFPDRILAVPYEELASDPQPWITRILSHAGLAIEPQAFEPHKQRRSVRTASVKQVRAPISTSQIGYSDKYSAFIKPFKDAYHA